MKGFFLLDQVIICVHAFYTYNDYEVVIFLIDKNIFKFLNTIFYIREIYKHFKNSNIHYVKNKK